MPEVSFEEFAGLAEPPPRPTGTKVKEISFDEFTGPDAAETPPPNPIPMSIKFLSDSLMSPLSGLKSANDYISDALVPSFASGVGGVLGGAARLPGLAAATVYKQPLLGLPEPIRSAATAAYKMIGYDPTTYTIPAWMKDNPVGRYFDEAAESYGYNRKKYPSDTTISLIQKGDYKAAGEYLANSVVESAPYTLLAIASTMAGHPEAGLMAIGGTSAGQKWGELKDLQLDDYTKLTSAWLHGGFDAVFESTPNLINWGKELFKDVGKQPLMTVIKNGLKYAFGSSFGEGNEEIWTQGSQDITDKILGVSNLSYREIGRRMLDAGITGFASGLVGTSTGGVIAGVTEQARTDRANAIKETLKKEAPQPVEKLSISKTPEGVFTLKPNVADLARGEKIEAKPAAPIEPFKNTQDAVAFGKANLGNEAVIGQLETKMADLDKQIEAEPDTNKAFRLTFERQFYREARDAAQGSKDFDSVISPTETPTVNVPRRTIEQSKAEVQTPEAQSFDAAYTPNEKLSPEQKTLEDNAAVYARENTEKILGEYKEANKKFVSVDEMREFLPDYRGDIANELHEPASALTKIFRNRVINDAIASGNNNFVISAGGPGVGKTSLINNQLEQGAIGDEVGAILDSNLANFDNATKLIDDLKGKGNVKIQYVFRDPVEAWKGVLERGGKEGRIVPLEQFIQISKSAHENIFKLAEKYGADLPMVFYEAKPGYQYDIMSLENLKSKPYNIEDLKEAFRDETNRQVKEGRLTEAQGNAILGLNQGAGILAGRREGAVSQAQVPGTEGQPTQVKQAIKTRLTAIGISPDVAESQSQIYEAAFKTLAEKSGLDPVQLFERYGPKISAPSENVQPETMTDEEFEQASFNNLIEKQRQTEGMSAAIRDPQTGELYTGPSHAEILEDAFKTDVELAERLSEELLNRTENTGFADENLEFVTREQAERRLGIVNSEMLRGKTFNQSAKKKDVTQTPEFKKWFGDSKAVDEEGKPLVVYHGTTSPQFTEFKYTLRGPGFWFTGNKEDAAFYSGKSGDVVETFLSIKNPADNKEYDSANQAAEKTLRPRKDFYEERDSRVREILKKKGFDGIHVIGKKDGSDIEINQWVAFEPTQIKSATGNVGMFDPNNPNIFEQTGKDNPRANIQFGDTSININLFKTADKSSFLHETGHLYLKMLGDLSALETAKPELINDANTVLNWLKADSFENITREQNEQFARGFEAYLMEGKAPTTALSQAFENFKKWLTEVYQALKNLDVQLSDEVRGVFDRLLTPSTDIQITRDTEQPSFPDEFYARALTQTKPTYFKQLSQNIGKASEDFRKFAEDIATPISTRLANIHPDLKYRLREFEFELRKQVKKDMGVLTEFLEKTKSMTPEDKVVFDLAQKNGDRVKIKNIAEKYKIDTDKIRGLLDDLYMRAKAAGYEVGYLSDYFPRMVKDKAGMLAYFHKDAKTWPIIEDAIAAKESQVGRALDENEQIELINSMIRGYGGGKLAMSRLGNMKDRHIAFVTPDINQYYFDSDQALIRYVSSFNEAIEAKRFFGKEINLDTNDESELNPRTLGDSIGAYVQKLVKDKKIKPEQELELRDLLQARFGFKTTNPIVGLYKNLTYIDTLGSPISAITQLEDIGVAFYKSILDTPGSFLKAAMNESNITTQDLGIETIWEEFQDKTALQGVIKKLFGATMFTRMDRLGKETYVNTVIESYRRQAKSGDTTALEEKLKPIFGEETDSVLADLKFDLKTDNLLLLAFNELLDAQPVALSEMQRNYLISPAGRIVYTLKSFMLKRIDFIRNEALSKIFSPDKATKIQGMKNLLRLWTLLGLFGAGVDELKDVILNRETSWSDRVIDNLLKPFGLGKWFLYMARREGIGKAFLLNLLPPIKWLDSIYKDITVNLPEGKKMDIPASIPIGGKLYYWWFGKGADKSAKKKKEKRGTSL